MFKYKLITVCILFLGLNGTAWGVSKPTYNLQKPIHTHGCHGLELTYGMSHKMHGFSGGYVCHFNDIWHMKLCGGFSNKNLLSWYNSYHVNLYSSYETMYLNFLMGLQGSYKFHHTCWLHFPKRFNAGIQMGLEMEYYLTDQMILVLLAETPISLFDKSKVLDYRLFGGFRITF
ncbi:hypothetical protein ACRRVD_03160 [Candidatus Cardinium hertigii]|uniref:hypothetical protein n=1 Tax=Candidatus Cardinium hertigii TaxID=247481 RepID=UPI003D7CE68E